MSLSPQHWMSIRWCSFCVALAFAEVMHVRSLKFEVDLFNKFIVFILFILFILLWSGTIGVGLASSFLNWRCDQQGVLIFYILFVSAHIAFILLILQGHKSENGTNQHEHFNDPAKPLHLSKHCSVNSLEHLWMTPTSSDNRTSCGFWAMWLLSWPVTLMQDQDYVFTHSEMVRIRLHRIYHCYDQMSANDTLEVALQLVQFAVL